MIFLEIADFFADRRLSHIGISAVQQFQIQDSLSDLANHILSSIQVSQEAKTLVRRGLFWLLGCGGAFPRVCDELVEAGVSMQRFELRIPTDAQIVSGL
jgi:hypothetical protein